MEKTIKQWLNELPEPARSRALKNAYSITLDYRTNSIKDALERSFIWEATPEGFGYWYLISDNLN